jgi:hypothetical protein
MLIEKASKANMLYFFKRFRKLGVSFGAFALIIYILYHSISTYLTDERIIDLLCKRNPSTELLMPGQVIDLEQTKDFKRQKLAQLKGEVYKIKQESLSVLGIGGEDQDAKTSESKTDKTPRQSFKVNLSAVKNTFEELWGITIVTYPGQKVEQTLMVGAGFKPINLNDQVLRWQKEIETAAEHYKLDPALIAAVMEQESGGNPEAISLSGAVGLMQLMPSTAELIGVNPYDPVQNIEGGAHYLKLQLESFGNLEAALAAYNSGPGSVEDGSWTTIPETMNYIQKVPRLLLKYEQIWRENQGRT